MRTFHLLNVKIRVKTTITTKPNLSLCARQGELIQSYIILLAAYSASLYLQDFFFCYLKEKFRLFFFYKIIVIFSLEKVLRSFAFREKT